MNTPTNRLPQDMVDNETTAPLSLEEETVSAAAPFVGRWQTLVSTTNWEKGRIIAEWRAELESSGSPVTQFSDEAWATLVGNVTSQHVGRLRRVHARYGEVFDQYPGLYWSHFQAALEWKDAEMWLEGAVQNGWSISQMRAKRWEVVGDDASESDAVMPEDEAEEGRTTPGWTEPSSAQGGTYSAGDEQSGASTGDKVGSSSDAVADSPLDATEADRDFGATGADVESAPPVRPFADLPELPDDLTEAFEQFKLAIVTHRLAGWKDATLVDVVACLDALKRLATAPVENE